jgi:hypothetical protein
MTDYPTYTYTQEQLAELEKAYESAAYCRAMRDQLSRATMGIPLALEQALATALSKALNWQVARIKSLHNAAELQGGAQ